MKFFNLALFLGVFFLAPSVFAQNANGGKLELKIAELWPSTYEDPVIRVFPKDTMYNPANCSNVSDGYFVNPVIPDDAQKRIYSTMLSGLATSRQLFAFVHTTQCYNNKPMIRTVVIR